MGLEGVGFSIACCEGHPEKVVVVAIIIVCLVVVVCCVALVVCCVDFVVIIFVLQLFIDCLIDGASLPRNIWFG